MVWPSTYMDGWMGQGGFGGEGTQQIAHKTEHIMKTMHNAHHCIALHCIALHCIALRTQQTKKMMAGFVDGELGLWER